MENHRTQVQNDLASTNARAAMTWGPGIMILVLSAQLGWWGHTIGWAAGLTWLAGFCFWNFARCRRVHCVFTGPFFLAMAIITLLAGFGVFHWGKETWSLLGGIVLIGGTALCCGPEMLWGRYWRGARNEQEEL